MDALTAIYDYIVHLDQNLMAVIARIGDWIYAVLFITIFSETGLVITAFLPGDSLLFASGALAARDSLKIVNLLLIFSIAATLGNISNYLIGRVIGAKFFTGTRFPILNPEQLQKAHRFYEKHGGKTIVAGRFLPFLRTLAPFVAGMGRMNFWRFLIFNIIACTSWSMSITLLGYFLGNIPIVKRNFALMIIGIVILALLPTVIQSSGKYLKKLLGGASA